MESKKRHDGDCLGCVKLREECDHHIEAAANFEMDLFSAKKEIASLRKALENIEVILKAPVEIGDAEVLQDINTVVTESLERRADK